MSTPQPVYTCAEHWDACVHARCGQVCLCVHTVLRALRSDTGGLAVYRTFLSTEDSLLFLSNLAHLAPQSTVHYAHQKLGPSLYQYVQTIEPLFKA